ncbi:MAG: hypothetical protein GF331_11480 [Chitinivibrionales bacterium]|nr:hypothetical protein [Chitinivibrionales bacterium]
MIHHTQPPRLCIHGRVNTGLLSVHVCTLLVVLVCLAQAEHVFIVHGYGSNRLVMRRMARYLADSGLTVHNWGYRSLTKTIPEIGDELLAEVAELSFEDTVSFVSHSMGGLVVRAMLGKAQGDTSFPVVRRVVMLAPPNKGAQLADFFSRWRFVRWAMGPNPRSMLTDTTSLVHHLHVPEDPELGIIAGARFDGEGYNPLIDGDDDGFMTVDRTRLGTEDDFAVLPVGHILMVRDPRVHEYVLAFLRNGAFPHDDRVDGDTFDTGRAE